MRTVLIGSDFVYNKNGELVPIEINTAVGLNGYSLENYIDAISITELTNFITQNGFTNVHYIGDIKPFSKKLEQQYTGSSVSYEFHNVGRDSITVPFIEDNDNTLIIRSAYDTTALVDDVYCKDKVNFLNLIKNQNFGSQFAHKGTDGSIVNNITTITDNGNHPNFILKHRYPNYDKEVYPKLFKVSNTTELDVVLNSMNSDDLLMEFHINQSKLYQNHLQVFRGMNILFPPNLESISLGGLTYFADNIISDSTFDSETFELQNIADRKKYLYQGELIKTPKLSIDDLVEMADGTFKRADELQIGDSVKSLNIANPAGIDISSEQTIYNISFEELQNSTTYTTNTITGLVRVSKFAPITKLTFTDGTDWFDTAGSHYLSIRNNQVRFLALKEDTGAVPGADYYVGIGDTILLIDTTNGELNFVQKEIQNIEYVNEFLDGFLITVTDQHIFLTKESQNANSSFVAVEHNVSCSLGWLSCGSSYQCGKQQCCGYSNQCVGGCNNCYTP